MSGNRMEKNKKIHDKLKEEEKQQLSKTMEYEKKIKSLDPFFNKQTSDDEEIEKIKVDDMEEFDKKVENKTSAAINRAEKRLGLYLEDEDEDEEKIIIKHKKKEVQVVSRKKENKNELIEVVEKPILKFEYTKEIFEANEDISNQPVSFTDKISVEELLRVRIEEQEKIRKTAKKVVKSPTNGMYTPEVMQEKINIVDGFDVRKEVKFKFQKETTDTVAKIVLSLLLIVVLVGSAVLAYLFLN